MLVLGFRTSIKAHFVENYIINKKKSRDLFFKFSSLQKLKDLEVDPLFEHFQNKGVTRSEHQKGVTWSLKVNQLRYLPYGLRHPYSFIYVPSRDF